MFKSSFSCFEVDVSTAVKSVRTHDNSYVEDFLGMTCILACIYMFKIYD